MERFLVSMSDLLTRIMYQIPQSNLYIHMDVLIHKGRHLPPGVPMTTDRACKKFIASSETTIS